MAGNLFFNRQNKEREEVNSEKKEIVMIDIGEIYPNPSQPRKFFGDEAIFRLADSIRSHGLIQPLTVRKTDRGYELIAGERRLRALKIIGQGEAPCVISQVDKEESAHLAIIENIQRENLNMFEQAQAIYNLMKVHCLTQEKIAAELSSSQSYVANKLRLLKISDEEKEIILENSLSERHARALLRIKDNEKRQIALRHIVSKELNVAATEEYIDKIIVEEKPTKQIGGKTKMYVKDVRLFVNTIEKAVETMRSSGLDVETVRRNRADVTEFIITVPNVSRGT